MGLRVLARGVWGALTGRVADVDRVGLEHDGHGDLDPLEFLRTGDKLVHQWKLWRDFERVLFGHRGQFLEWPLLLHPGFFTLHFA